MGCRERGSTGWQDYSYDEKRGNWGVSPGDLSFTAPTQEILWAEISSCYPGSIVEGWSIKPNSVGWLVATPPQVYAYAYDEDGDRRVPVSRNETTLGSTTREALVAGILCFGGGSTEDQWNIEELPSGEWRAIKR